MPLFPHNGSDYGHHYGDRPARGPHSSPSLRPQSPRPMRPTPPPPPAPQAMDLGGMGVLCPASGYHFLPVMMQFQGKEFHRLEGYPIWVYRCACCGSVRAFVIDYRTGGPRLLHVTPPSGQIG